MVIQMNGDLKIKAENLIDEAYNKGKNDAKREISLSGEYERAYQRGLDDAWECARNIVAGEYLGTLDTGMILNISAVEAMAEIDGKKRFCNFIQKPCPYEIECDECEVQCSYDRACKKVEVRS